jgi:hypothetical protein
MTRPVASDGRTPPRMPPDLCGRRYSVAVSELSFTHADEPAALFRSVGYADIPAYNENGYARYWFAKPLG